VAAHPERGHHRQRGGAGDTHRILVLGGVMLGVTLAVGVAAIVGVFVGARSSMAFGRDLRAALFRRVEASPRWS